MICTSVLPLSSCSTFVANFMKFTSVVFVVLLKIQKKRPLRKSLSRSENLSYNILSVLCAFEVLGTKCADSASLLCLLSLH